MKKIFCIILATLLLIGAAGGITWQYVTHIERAGITMTTADYTVNKDDEITVFVTASSAEPMSYVKATLSYDSEMLEPVVSDIVQTEADGEVNVIDTLKDNETEKTYEVKFTALKAGNTTINMYDAYVEDAKTEKLTNVGDNSEGLTLTVEDVKDIADAEDAEHK